MSGRHRFGSAARRAAAIIAFAVLLAGCASAEKNLTVPSTTATPASSGGSSSSGGMAGMNMGSASSTSGGSVSVGGVKAVPTQLLGSALWQGMKISAEATTPLPFVIYNGTSEQLVRAGPKASFHLMVMLSDAQTGVAIPYATVWATIRQNGQDLLRRSPVANDLQVHGTSLRKRRERSRSRHLSAEPARQPARLRAARRVPGRVAPSPPGEPHVPLDTAVMSAVTRGGHVRSC